MTNPYDELLAITVDLEQLAERGRQPETLGRINRLRQAADEVDKAWSGSWLGYHANVYYANLQPPPPGAHFSKEWGLTRMAFVRDSTNGDWAERDPEEVKRTIIERAGNPDMNPATEFIESARLRFPRQKSNLLSIIEIVGTHTTQSQFLNDQMEEARNLSLISGDQYISSWIPSRSNSRDSKAVYQGHWVPPHVRILAQAASFQTTVDVVTNLAEIAERVASHTSRLRQQPLPIAPLGTRVFIGHGHSHMWRELKDFLVDQLALTVDEFNRIPAAGVSTTGRLSAMLDSAAIAFLVMTGEDEQPGGELRPRENVVHEAGLFQGHLGFERAIVLLEDGCKKFSNNAGLIHISFPRNHIRAAFQDVREVLEREGVLSSRSNP